MWFVFCTVVVLTCFVMLGVCMCGFCKVWVCIYVDFVKCGCVYVLVLLYVGVSVIRVLVFTVFCIACTVFLYCFFYVYYLFVCNSVENTATE